MVLDKGQTCWHTPTMSMLAFFPWLTLESDLAIEGYHLLRFHRGSLPGKEQQTIDGVLEAYLEGETRSVSRATILTTDDRGIIDELSDEQMADVFEVAELVAFAGLAGREYFLPGGMKYCNRETFNLIVQRFQSTSQGVAVFSRRRDGSTHTYVTASQNRVRRPISQYGVSGVGLDVSFLTALIQARDHQDWEHLTEAIYFFNKANTDSDLVSEESECVEMVGAFERLLQCFHGKEDEVAQRFLALWEPSEWLEPVSCERVPADKRGRPVVETWLRDFFGYRGFHAHGRKAIWRPTIWSRREHLLLGAYGFSLLVKLWLKERSLYQLTDRDEPDIDVFEKLICGKHFEPQPDDEAPHYPWHEIRGTAAFHRAFERGWKTMFGATTEDPRPDGEDQNPDAEDTSTS